MPQTLRDYQSESVIDLRLNVRDGYKRLLLVAATGSGKTTVAAHIIDSAVSRRKKVVFLAHRKELIDQCSKRLDDQGIDHGIIKAGNKRVAPHLPVQVASVLTLIRRKEKPHADLFIIDEAHRSMAKSYLTILDFYPDAIVLGLTATPFRLDGKGLGHIFEKIIECSSISELTDLGFLIPARIFSTPVLPSFKKIKKRGGDLDANEQEKVVNTSAIIGNIYEHWKKYADGRTTVGFGVTRKHAKDLCDLFVSKGERSEYLDALMSEEQREAVLQRLHTGETTIIWNVGILTEGWDEPRTSCIIMARRTESIALYLQMAGRALRPFQGKEDCIILDHGGNTLSHGFITDERFYDLDGISSRKNKEAEKIIRTCAKCFALYSGTLCPECGHKNEVRTSAVKEVNGELVEIDVKARKLDEKRYFHEMLRRQVHGGYKDNYAAARFFSRFQKWPGKEHGVKPKWIRQNNRYKINGWDYSKAIREATYGQKRKVGTIGDSFRVGKRTA